MAERAVGSITHDILHSLDAGERGEKGSFPAALTEKTADHRIEFGFQYRDIPFVVRAVAHDLGTDMEFAPVSAICRTPRKTRSGG